MTGKPKVDMWRPWPFLTKLQIEQSPSFKLGMSFKAEKKLRSASCKVIAEAGQSTMPTDRPAEWGFCACRVLKHVNMQERPWIRE